jgi:Clp amino terminal domain, pathogenicity island component
VPRSVVDLAALAAQDEHPGQALSAIAELRGRLDELEDVQVENARRLGWSWSDIAKPLGISRQAVHHKHATRVLDGDRGGRLGDVRRCLARARREAAALGHDSVGSDHLLLGLLADESAARPLRELGVSPGDVREAVVQRRHTTRRRPGIETTKSSRAEAVPDRWLREALPLRAEGLTAGDALLALLRDEIGAASQVLARLGVSAAAIEERVARAR